MSISRSFNKSAKRKSKRKDNPRKRPSPFCIRLSDTERERLTGEASGLPLGTYIKAKALNERPLRTRRTGLCVKDRTALAKILALLGKSRISSNLNQLAHAANIGSLPMTPETEQYLFAALRDVTDIRRLLLKALGMKPEASS